MTPPIQFAFLLFCGFWVILFIVSLKRKAEKDFEVEERRQELQELKEQKELDKSRSELDQLLEEMKEEESNHITGEQIDKVLLHLAQKGVLSTQQYQELKMKAVFLYR